MSAASELDASFVFIAPESAHTTADASSSEAQVQRAGISDPQSPVHPSSDHRYEPGSCSSYAHDWSGQLKPHGRHFIDVYGRVCQPRGVNIGGSSKSPINHVHEAFPGDHATVSFVGRPFPLEEADEHFARLRRWGLTFIRFLVTWEAVEHTGPGIYDTEYLEYIRQLLSVLPKYGMVAFVVLHQDVWSRYSGGSGAPAWTLEAVGFDLHALEESGAAWLLGVKGGGQVEAERGVWPCGYQKLAAATMATCFWGGDTFAPQLKITARDGRQVPVQQYLQDAFLNMWEMVLKTVADLDAVIGFELMNEPHRGYIDLPSLHQFDYNTDLHLSHVPSALQSFMLAAGYPTLVDKWTRSFPMPTRRTSSSVLNSAGRNAWRKDGPTEGKCLWEKHNIWGWDLSKKEGVVLRENYFVTHPMTGKKVDWYTDFYYPFVKRWTKIVEQRSNNKMLFLEPIPNELCPTSWAREHQPKNMVYAPHWYDLNALFAKAFGDFTVNVQGISRGMFPLKAFHWGQKGARDNFSLQIRNVVEAAYKSLGETPVFIGECGVPMDMNNGEAFETDDWTWQLRMMDAMITGLEQSLVGFTLWNYNPDNDDKNGDHWNGENFSWFSRRRGLPKTFLNYHQASATLDNGARILDAILRPYPAKTAGTPLSFQYEMNTGEFTYVWANSSQKTIPPPSSTIGNPPLYLPLSSRETEIFIPWNLTNGRKLMVQGLEPEDKYSHDASRQTLFIVTADCDTPGKKHKIVVSVLPERRGYFELNDFWSDYGFMVSALGGLIVSLIMYLLIPILVR